MKTMGMIVTVLLSLGLDAAKAQEVQNVIIDSGSQSAGCVIPRLEGERIPFPLRKANTKFELAENETYLLNGTIVTMNGKSFFKVDFNSQPWLATEKLLQNPYFPVDESTIQVRNMSGRVVQLAVVAHQNDTGSQIEGGNSALKLVPILPAAPYGN